MTTREKLALIIVNEWNAANGNAPVVEWQELPAYQKKLALRMVDAVLDEMREPSDEACIASLGAFLVRPPSSMDEDHDAVISARRLRDEAWAALIDAIKSGA